MCRIRVAAASAGQSWMAEKMLLHVVAYTEERRACVDGQRVRLLRGTDYFELPDVDRLKEVCSFVITTR